MFINNHEENTRINQSLMTDILALLQSLSPLTKTTIRQLSVIIPALLAMTGRVTMLGVSCWQKKGQLPTIQRFFHTAIPGQLCSGCSFGTICLMQSYLSSGRR